MATYYYTQPEIEKGEYTHEENHEGKLNGELVRILCYEEKEIMKDLHDWIPVTERMLTTFLSQHPKKISENAKLIGFEIFNIDILFEDSNNIYVVEAKRNNGCFNNGCLKATVINRAISQLKGYCNVIEQQNINKKIIPIVAIMNMDETKQLEERKKNMIERNKKREKELKARRIEEMKLKEKKMIERQKILDQRQVERQKILDQQQIERQKIMDKTEKVKGHEANGFIKLRNSYRIETEEDLKELFNAIPKDKSLVIPNKCIKNINIKEVVKDIKINLGEQSCNVSCGQYFTSIRKNF